MSGGGITPSDRFEKAVKLTLADGQMRANLRHATTTIRRKRQRAQDEVPDWQELRDRAARMKDDAHARLPELLIQLEERVQDAGGRVHWARDAAEAREIVAAIAAGYGLNRVVKVKSMTTDEIELNDFLASRGIAAVETDLAELICQLAGDRPSHILVPAIHRNRREIQELFRRTLGADLPTDNPAELAEAARLHLRRTFLAAEMAVSGANFAVAETGTVAVVESEGNGRMCLTLPRVLATVMGVEKVFPLWSDVELMLRLLPRSSTAERMNPYTSFWTGVRPGDGPQEFHLILLDNGRSRVLADPSTRETLRCIRCSACLNVCPVYERAGGHAYGSVYPGPIGAILTPQLLGMEHGEANSLPGASSLCGACLEVCPVKIDIPRILVELRAKAGVKPAESAGLKAAAWAMASPRRFEAAIRWARRGRGLAPLLPGPLSGWLQGRDLPEMPARSFREEWRRSR
ncbi:MAG: lactate utilization protein [Fimbriimonadaceae bacterium]|nr:lactate utilization protein [Fimbriimonadaceae bacterium]